jgi:hypothetical protein
MRPLANPDTNVRRARTAFRLSRAMSLIAALVLATVGAVTSPASADSNQVPFEAHVSGDVVPIDQTTLHLTGSGRGSHLGLLDDYQGQVTITSVDDDGVIRDVLIETFTAANGDTLTIRCDQVVVVGGDGLFHGTDTWTVIGGTGRFEGATGSGIGTTEVHNLETFTKELTGTISY